MVSKPGSIIGLSSKGKGYCGFSLVDHLCGVNDRVKGKMADLNEIVLVFSA